MIRIQTNFENKLKADEEARTHHGLRHGEYEIKRNENKNGYSIWVKPRLNRPRRAKNA